MPLNVDAAVELVRAAPADDVVEQAALVRVGLARAAELERALLERIRIDVEHGVPAVAILTRDVEAVDEVAALGRRAPGGRLRLQEHLRAADVDLVHDDAGHDARHRPDVDAIRQRLELLARDHGLLQRARRIEERRVTGHRHAFRPLSPISSRKSARAVALALTRMSRNSKGRNPCSSPLTM